MKYTTRAVLIFFTFWLSAIAAYAADLSAAVTPFRTGGIAGPLNTVGDGYCPSTVTPGCDMSDSDSRVRTNDIVEYRFGLQVDPPGDDVTLTVNLKPGLVFEQIPGGCDPFNSSISGDGTIGNESELVCAIGFRSAWAAELDFAVKVLGTLGDGTSVGIESVEFNGPNSTAVTAPSIPDLTVTAAPRLDLHKRTSVFIQGTRDGVSGVDITYRMWIGLWDNVGPNPLLGYENITQDITFTEDLSAISPNAYIYQCSSTAANSIFPNNTFDPAFPERSLINSGTMSCPTGVTATGSVPITLSGADLSFSHIPTEDRFGRSLQADYRVGSYAIIGVFVPFTDIPASGTLSTTNTLTNLTATSITSQPNFLGAGEDVSNNSLSLVLENRVGAFSHTYRCYIATQTPPPWCTAAWSTGPTNASGVGTGDGLAEPEQTFVSYTLYRNRSFFDDSYVDVCSVFDDRYYEPVKYDGTNAARCHGTCGTLGTDYVIEYGVGYHATAWRDEATTPDEAIRDECNTDASNWFTNFDTASAAGTITKSRIRRLTPGGAGNTFAIATSLQAYDAVNIPSSVPNGTLLKTWGAYRAQTGEVDYRDCNYIARTASETHSRNSCGDRLILSRATARLAKTTLPGDTANFLEAGGMVQFRLTPTFTSIGGSINDNVFIVDTLPINASYVPGSATQNGVAFEPIIAGSPASGQTLTWDLGTLAVNVPIDPIDFSMTTSGLTPNGTLMTNTGRIDAISDISTAAQRSDERTVTVTSPSAMVMDKVVSIGGVETDMPIEYTISYLNGTSTNFNVVDVIDVLPYVGDGRFPASNFGGTIALGQLTTQSSSAQFYVTKQSSASLESDPNDTSNDLLSGSTPWCQMTAAHILNPSATPSSGGSSALCPQTGQEVKGVRLIDTQVLIPSASRSFTLGLILFGNASNDVYTNRAQGTSDGIALSPLSPYASTSVIGFGELAGNKVVEVWDPNNEGLYAIPGNEIIYTILVENTGTGPIDSGSIFLVDNLPAEIEFWNGDIDAGGANNFPVTAAVGFEQVSGTGVIFNPATDLGYSSAAAAPTDFSQCTFTPLDGTFRADFNYICFQPQGSLGNGTPTPKIAFSFRARLK